MKEYFKSIIEDSLQIRTSLLENLQENALNMQGTLSLLKKNYELQLMRAQKEKKKLELMEQREEKLELMERREFKILEKNVDSIKDPILREYFCAEQIRIYEKQAQNQQSEGVSGSSNVFGQFFGGLGGNGDDLLKY